MMISKKLDNFVNNLHFSTDKVDVRKEFFVSIDGEKVFDYYYIVVRGVEKRYIFKIYDKNHMSSIGEFNHKYFKTQQNMIDYITNIVEKVIK